MTELWAAAVGALVGGLIGFFASTYSSSFADDRSRQIRTIGIARALLADIQRIKGALGTDPNLFVGKRGAIRFLPPTISEWVAPLIAEIALASGQIVSRLMALEAQLANFRTMIAKTEDAQAEAQKAESERAAVVGRATPAFTGSGQAVWSTDVQSVQAAHDAALEWERTMMNAVARVHEETMITLEALAETLRPLATAPTPERTPLPAADRFVAKS